MNLDRASILCGNGCRAGDVVPRARVFRARCQFVSHCTRTMLTIFNTGRNQFAKHATRWFLYCAILLTPLKLLQASSPV